MTPIRRDADHHAEFVSQFVDLGEELVDQRFAARELEPKRARVAHDVK